MSIQPPEQLSESEYLDQEIRLARRAMQHAQAQLKEDARRLADPRVWIQSYPLACSLAACAAGALLARGAHWRVAEAEAPQAEAVEAEKGGNGWSSSFLRDLGTALRKSLVRMLTSGLVSHAMRVFESYANPDAVYPGYEENASESEEADMGSQI
jgi:hypothetical protein